MHKAGLRVSSATIRNVLAQLEDMGYVWQPHTSAGRVPTDLGYRFYVDLLLEGRRATRDVSGVEVGESTLALGVPVGKKMAPRLATIRTMPPMKRSSTGVCDTMP